MAALKRLKRDLKGIEKADEKDDGISFFVTPGDTDLDFTVFVPGPEDSPYDGGSFILEFKVPKTFPKAPPKVKFITKVYHMNVNEKGQICLAMLKDDWTAKTTIYQICEAIFKLLETPDDDNPLNNDIAQLYKSDKKKHDAKATEWTEKYAQ